MDFFVWVKDCVLWIASSLKFDAAPGVVVSGLLVGLALALCFWWVLSKKRTNALDYVEKVLKDTTKDNLCEKLPQIDENIKTQASNNEECHKSIANAWESYRETCYEDDTKKIMYSTTRPHNFFNPHDLNFTPGFYKALPNLFVSTGLALTFLGLISALNTIGGSISDSALEELLTVASAKFIMSLTGLFCSIVFSICLNRKNNVLEKKLHKTNSKIEELFTFRTLESIAAEQLRVTNENRTTFQTIATEMVAQIARPLKEDLPLVIANSIKEGIEPIFKKIGESSTEGVGDLVKGLSEQLSGQLSVSLSNASDKISLAGDKIQDLIDSMGNSSGKMSAEMENAIGQISITLESIRHGMQASAKSTSDMFTEGTERLLSAMNGTLVGIKENTGQGAEAIKSAATEMREAATLIRKELESAGKEAGASARQEFDKSTITASEALANAGISISNSLKLVADQAGKQSTEINHKVQHELMTTIDDITLKLKPLLESLESTGQHYQLLSAAIQSGASATETASINFDGSSRRLISAVQPVSVMIENIESSTRQLQESTTNNLTIIATAARQNAEQSQHVLMSAQEALGGQHDAMKGTIDAIRSLARDFEMQAKRLDDMDIKLGEAFNRYQVNVDGAVNTLKDHVSKMQSDLSQSLDTMHAIVDKAERFMPKQTR